MEESWTWKWWIIIPFKCIDMDVMIFPLITGQIIGKFYWELRLTKSPLWNINITTDTIHYSHCKNLKHFNWKYSIWWFWLERYFYLYLIRPRWCPYVNIGWKCFIFFWQKQKQERRRLFSQIQSSIIRKYNKAGILFAKNINLLPFTKKIITFRKANNCSTVPWWVTHRAVLLIEIIWIKKGISYQTREEETMSCRVSSWETE